jgi:hypothetical protein
MPLLEGEATQPIEPQANVTLASPDDPRHTRMAEMMILAGSGELCCRDLFHVGTPAESLLATTCDKLSTEQYFTRRRRLKSVAMVSLTKQATTTAISGTPTGLRPLAIGARLIGWIK